LPNRRKNISPLKSHNFTRDLTIVVLILSAVVIAPVAYLSSQARRNISEQYIDNSTTAAVSEFRAMADAMKLSLELVRDWGVSDLMSLSDSNGINKLFFPLLEREKILYAISIADQDGGSYHIRHDGEYLRTSEIKANSTPRQSRVRLWDTVEKVISDEKNPSDYDPRQRPWYAPALSSGTVFWSEPYRFYSSGSVGITASLSYLKKNGQQVVVALDILLDDLYLGIHKMAPSENSRVFIFRRDSKLYVPKSAESAPDFLSFTAVQDELIRKAHSIWSGTELTKGNAVSIRHGNTVWWCGFQPLDELQRDSWISVMVPENDIIGDISQRRLTLWLIGITTILCCTGLIVWLVRRYGRSAHSSSDIFDRNDPVGSILRIIAAGESRTVEFKSTMRMNLYTGKPGKEIEIAWLKGVAAFLNTDGGILLIGITDDGEITGLIRDDFDNKDRCQLHFKNLVAAHIGAQFSKNIHFSIEDVAGEEVGVIRCKRSAEPVFLKHPKGESFFIRSGPSSDELPVSKALEYIKHRKK